MLLINNLKLSLDKDESELKNLIEKKLKRKISSYIIHKKSLDARKSPVYVYSVLVEIDNEERYLGKDIHQYVIEDLNPVYKKRNKKVIIVGYGPSGIFAAYRLVKAGFDVTVFEKGKRIKDRVKDVERFFNDGILDENSNIQFGEGGAGTFSDAKLTTRIKSKYISFILDVFIRHGANPSIAYTAHSHIGTDHIREIIANITDYLINEGCKFHFEEEMKELLLNDNHEAIGIKTHKDYYYADYVILGIGHSARDSVMMLKEKGIYIENKDMAIGFRVEHPQDFINLRQTNNQLSEANEYFLTYKDKKGVYSFCMCPGGMVIPAMSEKDTVVTNGMSYSKRDSGFANSAILIQIKKEEFSDGYEYLSKIEKMAYAYSGSYKALSQNISDFMNNELQPLKFKSTYPLGTVLYNFNDFFNEDDLLIMKKAFIDFDRKINGFIEKGIIVGPETRSSSPIRINRNENYQSINTRNLYPMGEGAGYGGGIISCCLDGIKISEEIIKENE